MIPKSERERLQSELSTLHELLEQVDTIDAVDDSTRASLQVVAADIQQILDQQDGKDEWTTLSERWREALLEFESQHPRVTQVIEQITSILANAGI